MSNLKIGIAASVFVIACCIVSFALPWYRITQQRIFGSSSLAPNTTTDFSWQDYQVNNLDTNLAATKSYSNAKYTNTAQVFNESLALLVVGAAVAIVHTILQLVAMLSKRIDRGICWKLLAALAGFGSTVLLALSLFLFLTLPTAFFKDKNCPGTTHDDQSQYCSDFYDTTTVNDTVVEYKVSWNPYVGWWMCVGAAFFALISTVSSLTTSRR